MSPMQGVVLMGGAGAGHVSGGLGCGSPAAAQTASALRALAAKGAGSVGLKRKRLNVVEDAGLARVATERAVTFLRKRALTHAEVWGTRRRRR